MEKRLKQFVGRKVVAVLEDGSLTGVLTGVGRDELLLADPLYLTPGLSPRPVDGQAVVPYASIAWVQVAP